MKVLWLGNIILPAIAEKENLSKVFVGGWMVGLSKQISRVNETKLLYVFDSSRKLSGNVDGYEYRGILCNTKSSKRLGNEYIYQLVAILNEFKPDVIHIWGTENQHSLAMVEAADIVGVLDRVIISIQGMVSVYADHYSAYLPNSILGGKTLKDLIKGNIRKGERIFREKGYLECEALRKVNHVIGRTDWDKACVWKINPNTNYHFNNETLRDEFYEGKWNYETCRKHSIFCSQGHYPIKGLHLILEALKILVEHYPDVKLYVGGKDYYSIPLVRRSRYEKYILQLIDENNLRENVVFTGNLSAKKMKDQYLNSNVFVSPSSIENSPNSVGEAMLLGVPVISSRVGGVHNMMSHGVEGYLYPADEPYLLAYYIQDIFENVENAVRMAENAQSRARITHNPQNNMTTLLQIYKEVLENNECI